MDFTKLVSLLDSSSLWFSRVDKLGDPYEGSWLPHLPLEQRSGVGVSDVFKSNHRFKKLSVESMPVNCWHMNEYESAAMWGIYTQTGQGIAVQSTFDNLTKCFDEVESPVFAGMVEYIDYDNYSFSSANRFVPLLHKRTSFTHEQEIRAIIWPAAAPSHRMEPIPGHGLAVKVDISTLIQHICVCPTAPAWVKELVRSVTHRYGLDIKVSGSIVGQEPLY